MNAQKIFEALEEDSQNSALGIICGELEAQGYAIIINEVPVTSEGFFEGKYPEIEKRLNDLKITLLMNGVVKQKFTVEFSEFHEIIIKK